MDISGQFRHAWQVAQAGRQGIDEGMSSFVAALPDTALYLLSIPTRAIITQVPDAHLRSALTPDMEKGVLSGKWVENRMIENSRNSPLKHYDFTTETPAMKSAREGTAVVTEGAAVIGSLAVSIWPRLAGGLTGASLIGTRAAAVGATAGQVVSTTGATLKGAEKAYKDKIAKIEPAPATP